MNRPLHALAVVAAVLTSVVVAPAMGAEEAKGGAPPAGIAYQPGPMYYGLPGYYMLQQENVQTEIELVPEQKEKLQEIAKQYYEGMQEKIGVTEQQKKKMQQVRADIQKKMMQLQQETLDKTLEVLTPEQRKKLDEAAEEMSKGWGQPGGKQ